MSSTSAPGRKWRSPPTAAREIGVEPQKILDLIASGEIVAVNIALHVGGKHRPRWRISDDAWQAFLQSRQNVKPPAPTPARRQRPKISQPYY